MKKLMSVILAATMAFGLAVPAMAETPQPGVPPEEAGAAIDTSNSGAANSGAGSQAVEIAFEVPETFTWTIPNMENIEVHPENHVLKFSHKDKIEISDCYLASNHHIELAFHTQVMHFLLNGMGYNLYARMKGINGVTWVRPTEGSIDVPFEIATEEDGIDSWYDSGKFEVENSFYASIEETTGTQDDTLVIHTNEQMEQLSFQ